MSFQVVIFKVHLFSSVCLFLFMMNFPTSETTSIIFFLSSHVCTDLYESNLDINSMKTGIIDTFFSRYILNSVNSINLITCPFIGCLVPYIS